MKLKNCLKITKTKRFQVFIYPNGHIKDCRSLDESFADSFEVIRNENGIYPIDEKLEYYLNCKVVEIVPCSDSVTVVAEM